MTTTLADAKALAAALALTEYVERYSVAVVRDEMGHAKYFGTDSRGDIFLTGVSTRYASCYWDKYVVVSPDGVARFIPNTELVFGYETPEQKEANRVHDVNVAHDLALASESFRRTIRLRHEHAEALAEDERRTERARGVIAYVHLLMQPIDFRANPYVDEDRALCGVLPMQALYWNGEESLDTEPLRGVRVCPACREIVGA